MINHLKTGDAPATVARNVNQHGQSGAFSRAELIAAYHQFLGRQRLLLNGDDGMVYMGLYDPTQTYTYNMVVVIQPGPAQGTYICVVFANTAAPDTGQGWVCLGGDYAAGVWV